MTARLSDACARGPWLVVDVRRRALFALLVDAAGKRWPCEDTLGARRSSYLPVELALDGDPNTAPGAAWCTRLNASLERRDARGTRACLDELWIEAHADGDERRIILDDPLALLCAGRLPEEAEPRRRVLAVLSSLVRRRFARLPLLVSRQGIDPEDVQPILVVPSWCSRHGEVLLARALRPAFARAPAFVAHEIAVAALAAEPGQASDVLVAEADSTDLRVHRVAVALDSERFRAGCLGSRSVSGAGWRLLVEGVRDALAGGGATDRGSRGVASRLDRALLGVVGAPFDVDLPGVPAVRLGFGRVRELLEAWRPSTALEQRLSAVARELGGHGGLVGSGPAFAFESYATLVRRGLSRHYLQRAEHDAATDRATRGVAAILDWVRVHPGCPVEVFSASTLRIGLPSRRAADLLPIDRLALGAGDTRTFRRRLRLGSDEGAADDALALDLLVGCEPDPPHPVHVTTLMLDAKALPANVDVDVRLRRHPRGERLRGHVAVRLPGGTTRAVLHFPAASGALGAAPPSQDSIPAAQTQSALATAAQAVRRNS